MENLTVGIIIAWFVYSVGIQIAQALQIRKCMDLLAARSYGEYANGKAKLTNPKPADTIDPGF